MRRLNRLTAYLASRLTPGPSRSDAGYSTEAVLVIALLATLALGALALISGAVLSKAESITLE
ncbi:hypothetical protein [Streptomonospora arabica]|uniref:Uncharacterized protein n=1 Tax=Streptomonospora arabica TaxID=412417 RepID=A0ABV9SIK9_9ACTN